MLAVNIKSLNLKILDKERLNKVFLKYCRPPGKEGKWLPLNGLCSNTSRVPGALFVSRRGAVVIWEIVRGRGALFASIRGQKEPEEMASGLQASRRAQD